MSLEQPIVNSIRDTPSVRLTRCHVDNCSVAWSLRLRMVLTSMPDVDLGHPVREHLAIPEPSCWPLGDPPPTRASAVAKRMICSDRILTITAGPSTSVAPAMSGIATRIDPSATVTIISYADILASACSLMTRSAAIASG